MRKIICPYCFAQFEHDEVHFRSEKANKGVCPYIPDDYDDFDDFMVNYRGADKEEIIAKYAEWSFFEEGPDEKYEAFWRRYGGTTTESLSETKAGYRRRVIDPANSSHQRYLRVMDSGRYTSEIEGFTTSIVLNSGEICTQRVCPECHNPLPSQYGKNECKFIAVIGVTGSGKTVYLSQLVYDFEDYVVKVGLSTLMTTDSPLVFRRNYPVDTKHELPGSTPPGQFLQPLFYDLSKDENGQKKDYTLVMYDVAGENCNMELAHSWFGPFIQHMDGVFLLIDPMQFKIIQGMSYDDSQDKARPTTVLNAIHHYISGGKSEKCNVPLAICMSKSDMGVVQDVLEEDLTEALMDDVVEVTDRMKNPRPMFNASQYNPIAIKLHDFIQENEHALETFIKTHYLRYNYFAFTSLGCDVQDNIPVGQPYPKRIEEPLLWLFYEFGFITSDVPVVSFGRPGCPLCGLNNHVNKLEGAQREIVTKRNLFGRIRETAFFDYYCSDCNDYFNEDGTSFSPGRR